MGELLLESRNGDKRLPFPDVNLIDVEYERMITALVERFTADLHTELSHRWTAWEFEFSRKDLHTVVSALLARQVTLAGEFAQSPSCWNYHVGPLFLRAMVDVHISVAWILHDSDKRVERSRKFIYFGVGQQKLYLEHWKSRSKKEGRDPSDDERKDLASIERWINSQRATFLTEVNVGSWSGVSVRKMAEEADCVDFYNYAYTPWSGVAHSMWQHVGRFNVNQCRNPLHGFHLTPAVPKLGMDLHLLYLAGKYVDKTLRLFDKKTGVKVEVPFAFSRLSKGIDGLLEVINRADQSTRTNARDSQKQANRILQRAFERAMELSQVEQAEFARFLLAELDSERRWSDLFVRPESEDLLERLADDALSEHNAGRDQPLSTDDL